MTRFPAADRPGLVVALQQAGDRVAPAAAGRDRRGWRWAVGERVPL